MSNFSDHLLIEYEKLRNEMVGLLSSYKKKYPDCAPMFTQYSFRPQPVRKPFLISLCEQSFYKGYEMAISFSQGVKEFQWSFTKAWDTLKTLKVTAHKHIDPIVGSKQINANIRGYCFANGLEKSFKLNYEIILKNGKVSHMYDSTNDELNSLKGVLFAVNSLRSKLGMEKEQSKAIDEFEKLKLIENQALKNIKRTDYSPKGSSINMNIIPKNKNLNIVIEDTNGVPKLIKQSPEDNLKGVITVSDGLDEEEGSPIETEAETDIAGEEEDVIAPEDEKRKHALLDFDDPSSPEKTPEDFAKENKVRLIVKPENIIEDKNGDGIIDERDFEDRNGDGVIDENDFTEEELQNEIIQKFLKNRKKANQNQETSVEETPVEPDANDTETLVPDEEPESENEQELLTPTDEDSNPPESIDQAESADDDKEQEDIDESERTLEEEKELLDEIEQLENLQNSNPENNNEELQN